MRSSRDEVYISGVSCSCVTCSSNSVASTGARGMGRPQLGLPRLRVCAPGIAIGPDHTPHRVSVQGIIARVARFRIEVRLPLFLLAAAVRLVASALVASGRGWLRLFARQFDGCGSWQPFVRLLDVCALQRPSLQRRGVCGLERLSVLQSCAWDSYLLRHDQFRGTALKPKLGRDARNADVWSRRRERNRPGFRGFCL